MQRAAIRLWTTVVVLAGCGVSFDTYDPFRTIAQPVASFVAGGFWEVSFDQTATQVNAERLPPPIDAMFERAVQAGTTSLALSSTTRRVFWELVNGNEIFLHDYNIEANTGYRTGTGHIFHREGEDRPSEPELVGLARSWAGQQFWIERGETGPQALLFKQRPKFRQLGELSIVLVPTYRISHISLDGIRLTLLWEIVLVADRDFPIIPPFRVLDMQRGETFPAKVTIAFTLKRSSAPYALGLPDPTNRDGGVELLFPIGELLQAALNGGDED